MYLSNGVSSGIAYFPRPPKNASGQKVSPLAVSGKSPVMCGFLDTGNDERRVALRRPASKKRQGTKSREVSRRLCRERYGDLIFAPAVMVGAMLASGDLHGCGKGAWKRAMGISVVA